MWFLGVPLGLFVLFVLIGLAGGWDSGNSKAAVVERECEKMLNDSALGPERRMARATCDQMKEIVRQEQKSGKY